MSQRFAGIQSIKVNTEEVSLTIFYPSAVMFLYEVQYNIRYGCHN